jgi:hypothetical protein
VRRVEELIMRWSSPASLCLLDSELRGGIGFEASVGYRQSAADRVAEGALLDPTVGPVEGREPLDQACGDGVVGLLGREGLGRIGEIARFVRRGAVVPTRGGRLTQELLHSGSLGVKQGTSSLFVHRSS